MDETQLRQAVCDASHQLWQRRLLHGDGGFVSAELNRRRFIVTPAGQRRVDLRPDRLMCVDLGGTDMLSGQPPVPEAAWLPHRLAYQGATYLETAGQGSREIHATALATPQNVMALHALEPGETQLSILHQPALPVVDAHDAKAIQQAILVGPLVVLRGQGVLCCDRSVAHCLNALEALEHHAAIDLATAGARE